MANEPQDLSAVAEQMKGILQRIVQAKNSPQEIERAVAEGQKQLDNLTKNQGQNKPGAGEQPYQQGQTQDQPDRRR